MYLLYSTQIRQKLCLFQEHSPTSTVGSSPHSYKAKLTECGHFNQTVLTHQRHAVFQFQLFMEKYN